MGDKEKRISSVESSTFSPGDGQEHQHLPSRALDPDEYQRAKRTLKKAVLEHYRLVSFILALTEANLGFF